MTLVGLGVLDTDAASVWEDATSSHIAKYYGLWNETSDRMASEFVETKITAQSLVVSPTGQNQRREQSSTANTISYEQRLTALAKRTPSSLPDVDATSSQSKALSIPFQEAPVVEEYIKSLKDSEGDEFVAFEELEAVSDVEVLPPITAVPTSSPTELDRTGTTQQARGSGGSGTSTWRSRWFIATIASVGMALIALIAFVIHRRRNDRSNGLFIDPGTDNGGVAATSEFVQPEVLDWDEEEEIDALGIRPSHSTQSNADHAPPHAASQLRYGSRPNRADYHNSHHPYGVEVTRAPPPQAFPQRARHGDDSYQH